MPQTCSRCSRINPDLAAYCYHDGARLQEASLNGSPARYQFPAPFVFPSGDQCRDFDQLALACQRHWDEASTLLRQGFLAPFLAGVGRADLAQAAQEAARQPDADRGLDQLLARLPSEVAESPRLQVEPRSVDLGRLAVGQDRTLSVRLMNAGMRLLHGTASLDDAPWLALGDGGAHEKLFQCRDACELALQVRGKYLRAGAKPLEAHLTVESNGGTYTLPLRAEVPVVPFPTGALAGALSPRQLAEKAKVYPKEAAALLEGGDVARWYEANGWSYPVLGPSASGLGAVQQLFEALGLTAPPKVEISEPSVRLSGEPDQELWHALQVRTQERRPVFAFATCDAPWLRVRVDLKGQTATVRLSVPGIPGRPGDLHEAKVTVTSNGRQRFVVPVTLEVTGQFAPALAPVALPAREVPLAVTAAPAPPPVPSTPAVAFPSGAVSANLPPPPVPLPLPPLGAEDAVAGVPGRRRHLVPLAALVLLLVGFLVRDFFLSGAAPVADDGPVDPRPRIVIRFHDAPDQYFDERTQRFGLTTDEVREPKKLTYDEQGRSNNTCVRIDGEEHLFGHRSRLGSGKWQRSRIALPAAEDGRARSGLRSEWLFDRENILITQHVEVVQGEPSRRYDTCLVRYTLRNAGEEARKVGLRFLLDTYIGGNDGVPFTIPGQQALCNTMHEFHTPEEVPDFIQALEREDLEKPGTVSHVRFRLGGKVEPPARVTLGAWPDEKLTRLRVAGANGQLTLWDVPVLPMDRLTEVDVTAKKDSAVVMYWPERELGPGEEREVGFAYGLGNVSGSGGRLALTVGGSFAPNGEFTVTALVREPSPGQTVTLVLPEGFTRLSGEATQPVPPLPEGATSRNSPVTWKVKGPPREGRYELKADTSTGASQKQAVTIKSSRIFD